MKTMKLLVAAVFGTALTMVTAPASAAALVVPSANTNVEGNSNNCYPYDIGAGCFVMNAQRYQQVYAASEFGSQAGYVTAIRYRPDAFSGAAFSAVLPNVEIILSVTPVTPATVSPTYANNFGPSQSVVYSGPLSLSSAFTGPAGGPKGFDIVIPLNFPFYYNPSQGNLLIQVKNFVGVTTTYFDAVLGSSSVGRVYNLTNDPNATTGVTEPGGGLVTQFVFIPDDLLQISYAANLGAGQSVIDVTNAGTVDPPIGLPDYLCVNVYTFAQDQQLISCCTCNLSPNDLQTLSVQNDLINNTLTPGVPTGVTVALVASDNGTGTGACDAATVAPAKLAPGMRAWGTHLHAAPGGGFALTETPFSKVALSAQELAKMTSYCGFIKANGSHFGICNSCTQGAAGSTKK